MKRSLIILLLILFCLGCKANEGTQPLTQAREAELTEAPAAETPFAEAPTPEPEQTPEPAPMPTLVPTPDLTEEEDVVSVGKAFETPLSLPTLPPPPTPTPTPEPTPTPTPEPTPEPTKDPNRPMVALTFDDGPNLKMTGQVLDKLEQYHVKATFYLLGSAINDKTGPLLQRMIDEGHEIGVHGLTHEKMTNFSRSKNATRFRSTMKEISGWIEGGYTPKTMRPPGGSSNGAVSSGAKDAGLAVVKWDVDTLDWKTQNVKKIMDVVKKATKNGSIILCHDHHQPTADALDEMIPWLLEQGYELVTVSELLESMPDGMQPGKVYSCKKIGN